MQETQPDLIGELSANLLSAIEGFVNSQITEVVSENPEASEEDLVEMILDRLYDDEGMRQEYKNYVLEKVRTLKKNT